jgi:prepilin-type N-terminal cleavage/methylation domain-containing protein
MLIIGLTNEDLPTPGNENSSSRENGFSLIEMMIAIVVILVGLISIVAISVYVSRANQTSNALNVLASAAQDQVDRLRTVVWSVSTEDPSLAVGGSLFVTSGSSTPVSSPTPMSASDYETSDSIYTYTPDPNNPHAADVANTPAGDLKITWQVRQGETADLRYVTIRIVQENPLPGLENGYTVTTIVSRN